MGKKSLQVLFSLCVTFLCHTYPRALQLQPYVTARPISPALSAADTAANPT